MANILTTPITAPTMAQKRLSHRPLMKVTDEQLGEELRQSAGLVYLVMAKYNINRCSLLKRIKKSKYLTQLVAEIRQEALDHAEFNILEGVKRGDHKYTAMILKYFGRLRGYEDVTRTEITGLNASPLVAVLGNLTDEQLKKMVGLDTNTIT